MDGNTSTIAHVVSSTTQSSGGTYNNTASFTSDNAGSGSDSASIVVQQHYVITTATGVSIVPGTTDIGNHGDDLVTQLTLPFAVMIYGQPYSSVNVSSNGNLQFGTTDNSWTNTCLPWADHGATFFPYWDDLRTDTGGSGVFSHVTGTAPNRTYYLEWRATYFADGGQAHFEWVIHEDNHSLQVIYGALADGAASSTEGVQDATVPIFDQYGCEGAGGSLSDGLQVTYTPAGEPPPETSRPLD